MFRQVDVYYRTRGGRLKLREMPGYDAQLIFYRREDRRGSRPSDFAIVPVAAEHAGTLHAILEAALGERVRVVKRRHLLIYRHTRIHLDEVEGLGRYVELETLLMDDQDEDDAWLEHQEVRRALGISPVRTVAGSYADLMARRQARLRRRS